MRRTRSERGSTLIEALVAMTIFALGASATMSLLMSSVAATRGNVLDAHAVTLATRIRENLRSVQYDSLVSGMTTGTITNDTSFKGTRFDVASVVQDNTPGANMKTVTVTVTWNYRGLTRTYAIPTVYTDMNG